MFHGSPPRLHILKILVPRTHPRDPAEVVLGVGWIPGYQVILVGRFKNPQLWDSTVSWI